jgi:hypothetical protein
MLRRFFILLSLIFSLQLCAQEFCSSLFDQLPILNNLNHQSRVFTNGKSYRLYEVSSSQLSNPEYNQMLKRSVEVLYEPSEPFGHLRLRVGERVYSFNNVQWTSQGNYIPRGGKDRFGFVYMVDEQKIKNLEDEIIRFYKSSQDYNIPPFDAYSPPIKIKRSGNGWKYESPSPKFANNEYANGEVIQEGSEYFLKSPDFKMKVKKTGPDEYETLSFSCVSSTTHWLERFGINLNRNLEAKGVKEVLLDPNHQTSSPHLIFRYLD